MCAAKVLPTEALEEIVSFVRTINVVPAGIVAAEDNWMAVKEQATRRAIGTLVHVGFGWFGD